jgi:hypothetical protein
VIIVKLQGVWTKSHRILEIAVRIKLRKDRGFEEFEGKTRVEVVS